MKSKEITNEKDLSFLFSLKSKDINKSLIMEMFGNFEGSPRFDPYDIITVPPNTYGPEGNMNKNSFVTTVGLWIYNKYVIEDTLFNIFKYINKELNGGVQKSMNKTISYAIIEDDLTVRDLEIYTAKCQHLMRFVSVLSPNHTMKMLTISDHINSKKAELVAKYKEELDAGNEIISEKIEKELLEEAMKFLGEDPSVDIYKSGARGSIDNNFKNMFIMKGAIMDYDQTFKISTSSFIDGISKEEYAMAANSLVAGAFAKAKNTEFGGYWAKVYTRAFQHLKLDPKDSDCGTKKYLTLELNSGNIDKYMYSYVIDGPNLVCITSKTKDKYMNKVVKLRFSSLCESKTGFCNKCIGDLFYSLDLKNIGMTTVQIPNKIMLLSMKKFHDATIKVTDMDVSKAFGF